MGMNLPLTEEDKNVAIGHYKKARAIYNLVEMKELAQYIDTIISNVNVGDTLSSTVTKSPLEVLKNEYENNLNTNGMNSEFTIVTGINYAGMLLHLSYHLEAERIIIKVATASRQVHGQQHKTTIKADKILQECKERYVLVLPDINKTFQALRYENEGKTCVVMGPITEPRKVEDETLHRIANNLVMPGKGCAVICHGLVSASHLNGELGEVRTMKQDETGMTRLGVNYEKKGVKSALVKPENLRIAFELPDEVM